MAHRQLAHQEYSNNGSLSVTLSSIFLGTSVCALVMCAHTFMPATTPWVYNACRHEHSAFGPVLRTVCFYACCRCTSSTVMPSSSSTRSTRSGDSQALRRVHTWLEMSMPSTREGALARNVNKHVTTWIKVNKHVNTWCNHAKGNKHVHTWAGCIHARHLSAAVSMPPATRGSLASPTVLCRSSKSLHDSLPLCQQR